MKKILLVAALIVCAGLATGCQNKCDNQAAGASSQAIPPAPIVIAPKPKCDE